MILHLSDGWAVALSSVVWFASSVVIGWVATRWSLERLATTGPVTTLRRWEDGGRFWQRYLHVRRWRDVVPEAGSLFGGYSKRRLVSRDTADLDRFRRETIRAERVHWLIMASALLHPLWCRPPVALGMLAFGVLFNAPFIIVQRANRGRLDRLLRRRGSTGRSRR